MLNQYLRLPPTPFNYANPELPYYFKEQFLMSQSNIPVANPVTDWGATLGRVLFYDTRLSRNFKISCGSCHQQQFGFTDTALFSKGFDGGSTKRHSMALVNAAYYFPARFFWDERAATLEDQVLMPLQDEVEMGMRIDTLIQRLEAVPYYPILFRNAFGTTSITKDHVAQALSQFVRSLVSYRSRYDEGRVQVAKPELDFPNFTSMENEGKKLFFLNPQVNCSGCHITDAFVGDFARNTGLTTTNADAGTFIHSQQETDRGRFKSPSLKNVALRQRYMHDGSLQGLDAILEFYNSGIQSNPTLDDHLIQNGHPARMNLNAQQLAALKAFLMTLTDEPMLRDEKFSSPF